MIPRTLLHYEILQKLGEGGMGTVYKARDTHLNRFVAIKVLPPDRPADGDRKLRFVQEAQAASALNHPNIITIHDAASDQGLDFIVMEFVAGKALDQIIPRKGMRLDEALTCAIQIADALAKAHAAGIIHRDLKPSNIMVNEEGLVKILDFGLAKLVGGSGTNERPDQATRTLKPLTEDGTILGTVSYMSPEQAEAKAVDARSDVFSFGAVLYEMLTGHRAFQGSTKLSTLSAILRDEPKPAADLGVALPHEVERLIGRCLKKDPERRYQLMKEVRIALEEFKSESESGQLQSIPRPAAKVRRAVLGYILAATVVALLALGALAWRWQKPLRTAPELRLRQLTLDAGLTANPSISPDGKLVAYISDRAGDGWINLWVQQLSRGAQPIRLTHHAADDIGLSFSPDGGQIAFTTHWAGGGLYVVPALGGEQRLLLRGEYNYPRFSPDGQFVVVTRIGSFTNKLLLVPAAGGPPRDVTQGFYNATGGVWSPDGKHVLFVGSKEAGMDSDWFVVPRDGGSAVACDVGGILKQTAALGLPAPREWLDDYVLFSDGNLKRLRLAAPTFRAAGLPERLTSGSAIEIQPRAISAGDGDRSKRWRIVFSNVRRSEALWSLTVDKRTQTHPPQAVRLIADAVPRATPALSADGKRLTYVMRGLDGFAVRARELASGTETTLVQSTVDVRARLSPDGAMLAYNPTAFDEKESVIFLVPFSGGEPRKLCDRCGLIYDWSPDGKKIVFRSGKPMHFSTINLATGIQTLLVANPQHQIHAAVYSPDSRWIALHFAPGDGPVGLFIAPLVDGKAAPESQWIHIMDRPGRHTRPWWSRDGTLLWFLSDAAGQVDIWRQRLDSATKRPLGEPEVFFHPSDRFRMSTGSPFGPGEAADRFVFPMSEESGNIWIAE